MRSFSRVVALGVCAVTVLTIFWPWLSGAKGSVLDVFFEAKREGVFLLWSAPLAALAAVVGSVLAVQVVKIEFGRDRRWTGTA